LLGRIAHNLLRLPKMVNPKGFFKRKGIKEKEAKEILIGKLIKIMVNSFSMEPLKPPS